ncbi:MAG: hypothetical protein ABI700_10615 [Chloroflexota bacterium]
MFELSHVELQVLKELWKLIQFKQTTYDTPFETVTRETSLSMPGALDDPVTDHRWESPAKDSPNLYSD